MISSSTLSVCSVFKASICLTSDRLSLSFLCSLGLVVRLFNHFLLIDTNLLSLHPSIASSRKTSRHPTSDQSAHLFSLFPHRLWRLRNLTFYRGRSILTSLQPPGAWVVFRAQRQVAALRVERVLWRSGSQMAVFRAQEEGMTLNWEKSIFPKNQLGNITQDSS